MLILPVDEKLGAHSIAVSHGEVRAMAVAPDGSWLATVGREAYAAQPSEPLVRLWDPRTGVVLVTLRGHTDDGTCLAVAPDGSWIASADAGGTILICDPRTGRQRHRISAHSGAVTALVVAPDGSWLASAGGPVWGHGDGAVRVWDPSNGKQLQSWSDDGGLMWTLAVSRDGRRLASCGRDGVIRVWDPTSGADIDRFVGPASSVADVSFTADGTALVAVVENVVQIWPFDRSTGPAALRVDGQLRHLGIVRDGVVVAGDHGPYWLRWT